MRSYTIGFLATFYTRITWSRHWHNFSVAVHVVLANRFSLDTKKKKNVGQVACFVRGCAYLCNPVITVTIFTFLSQKRFSHFEKQVLDDDKERFELILFSLFYFFLSITKFGIWKKRSCTLFSHGPNIIRQIFLDLRTQTKRPFSTSKSCPVAVIHCLQSSY